jgi:hypothetical protein
MAADMLRLHVPCSFEQNNLRYWHKQTKVPLVQLVGGLPAVDTGEGRAWQPPAATLAPDKRLCCWPYTLGLPGCQQF